MRNGFLKTQIWPKLSTFPYIKGKDPFPTNMALHLIPYKFCKYMWKILQLSWSEMSWESTILETESDLLLFSKILEGYTDKKENQIFLIYKEVQSGAVAKSYMRKGFLIYEEI